MLSPYDAMSHRYWRENLVSEFAEVEFTQIVLPARYFSWRFRGNSLTMSHDARLDGIYDLLIATSMTDLSSLIGMNKKIAGLPSVLYFHENQFAYPQSKHSETEKQDRVIERQITSLYSAIAADQLVFNSAFNRDTFLSGVKSLLRKMPDHVPAGIDVSLEAKSSVLPVPLGDECYQNNRKSPRFSIVWNHRWEYDKGLGELRQIVHGLLNHGLDFELHLIGQQFRSIPSAIQEIIDLLKVNKALGKLGFIEDRDEYLSLLGTCHCVLSTAKHEFQGLSVQEAMASACTPVVPDSLSYPEYVPRELRYCNAAGAVDLIERIARGEVSLESGSVDSISWRRQSSSWKAYLGA